MNSFRSAGMGSLSPSRRHSRISPVPEGSRSDAGRCPVCGGPLEPVGRRYDLDEILTLWAPVRFPPETVEEHRIQSGHTRPHACTGCGLEIFLPPIIGTPAFYAALQGSPHAPYYVEGKWEFDEALADLEGCASLIEVGCGPGAFLELARPHVPETYGIEYNAEALEAARGKGLTIFGAGEDVPAAVGPVDAAFSFHVLEHVADPVDFLRGISALVKPGGRIGISVPNMDGPVRYVVPCASNMPPHHATRWRLRTLRALAEKVGLRVARSAFEPLCARDHYYYSEYWVRTLFPERSFRFRAARALLSRSFDAGFRVLSTFGRRTAPLLKGQSLYLLLAKPGG